MRKTAKQYKIERSKQKYRRKNRTSSEISDDAEMSQVTFQRNTVVFDIWSNTLHYRPYKTMYFLASPPTKRCFLCCIGGAVYAHGCCSPR